MRSFTLVCFAVLFVAGLAVGAYGLLSEDTEQEQTAAQTPNPDDAHGDRAGWRDDDGHPDRRSVLSGLPRRAAPGPRRDPRTVRRDLQREVQAVPARYQAVPRAHADRRQPVKISDFSRRPPQTAAFFIPNLCPYIPLDTILRLPYTPPRAFAPYLGQRTLSLFPLELEDLTPPGGAPILRNIRPKKRPTCLTGMRTLTM